MKQRIPLYWLACIVLLLAGLYGKSHAQGTFDIRFVHMAEGGPNADVHFNNTAQATISNLAYEHTTPLVRSLPVGSGPVNVKIAPAGTGLAGAIIDQNVTVAAAMEYSGIIYLSGTQAKLKVLERARTKVPQPNKALVRVLNLTRFTTPPALDFYLDSLAGNPLFPAVAPEAATQFADVKGEPSTLFITATGSKTASAKFVAPFTAGGRVTLIVTGSSTSDLKVHLLRGEELTAHKLPVLQSVEGGGLLSSVRVVHAWRKHKVLGTGLQALDIYLDDNLRIPDLRYRVASEKIGPLVDDSATIKFALLNEGASSAIYTEKFRLQQDSDYVVILTRSMQGAPSALRLSAPNSIPANFTDSFYIRAANVTDFHKNITLKVVPGSGPAFNLPQTQFLTATDWFTMPRGAFKVEAYRPGEDAPFYTNQHHGSFASTYLTVIMMGDDSTFEIDILNELLPQRQVFDPSSSVPVVVAGDAAAFGLRSFPNPVSGDASVAFTLPRPGRVTISLFNYLGREVATLLDEPRDAGDGVVEFDAAGLPSGTYVYRLRTERGESAVGRMVIAR